MALETDLADLSKQPRDLPLLATKETCTGNTYIVTGSNVGLGLEAVRHLVNLGATKVILAVRNVAAGDAAKAEIENSTGRSGVAEVWHLDMGSYASVQAFAQKASTDLDRIDALIENAGTATSYSSRGNLREGHLPDLTVNVYSTILLALLMLPKLREVAQRYGTTPRIAIVSSTAWVMNPLPLEKVQHDPLRMLEADESLLPAVYPLTKLYEVLAVRHIASALPVSSSKVVVNSLNPGLCKTELARSVTGEERKQYEQMLHAYGRTAEDGSRTLVHAAFSGKETHGKFLSSCEIVDHMLPDWMKNDKNLENLVWDNIAEEIEKAAPGLVNKTLQI